MTTCHGSLSAPPPTASSFWIIIVGGSMLTSTASTVTVPTSRFTATAILSSGLSAIAEPRVGPGAVIAQAIPPPDPPAPPVLDVVEVDVVMPPEPTVDELDEEE